jgi:hypothetical protein
MKSPLDDLIGHVRAVIVARVDMVYASGYCLSQNCNCGIDVSWRSKNLRAGKLHRAVAHPVQADRCAGECACAAEFCLFRQCVFPFYYYVFSMFLASTWND